MALIGGFKEEDSVASENSSKHRGAIDMSASGEMPRTQCRSTHDVCRPHQSF